MGNSLHNKIYLGRSAVRGNRAVRFLFAVGIAAGVALALALLRATR